MSPDRGVPGRPGVPGQDLRRRRAAGHRPGAAAAPDAAGAGRAEGVGAAAAAGRHAARLPGRRARRRLPLDGDRREAGRRHRHRVAAPVQRGRLPGQGPDVAVPLGRRWSSSPPTTCARRCCPMCSIRRRRWPPSCSPTCTPDEPHPAFRSLFDQRVFLRDQRERGSTSPRRCEVNGRDIDLVITGAKGRLAVECDGQDWHGTPGAARGRPGPGAGAQAGRLAVLAGPRERVPLRPRRRAGHRCGRPSTGSTSSPYDPADFVGAGHRRDRLAARAAVHRRGSGRARRRRARGARRRAPGRLSMQGHLAGAWRGVQGSLSRRGA